MALNPGDRLGPYEIVSILGEGGMGRVYRARDTKLQRHVAIKVLPDTVAGDPERIARFDREALTLATLNHPHIAQIYGTEQSSTSHALVMELVEGEDLSQRIARGPIPWRDAEPVARQIAEALEAAHEQGIVHRDLKPANIKLTPDGIVKVLDFGLAKAVEPGTGNREPGAGTGELANSPTITSPAGMTQAGIILGTAAYMSPEQSKGRPADKRSDVWAFGCVLYEMLTGKRAFPGDDVMETLSAVIRAEPDWKALPKDVPPAARTLIERCLIKDRRARASDIAVARYALETAESSPAAQSAASRSRNVWPWAFAALAGIIAIGTVALPRLSTSAPEPAPVTRSTIATPGAVTVGFSTIALSRQGTTIAYQSTQGRITLRRLADSEGRQLQGTEGGANPFFSPDGQWLGFFADGKLKKMSIAGGPAQVLADAPSGRGGTWGPDGTIVFAPEPSAGLSKVSADGAVTALTQLAPNERSHRWPHLLPDGRTVLFTSQPAGKLYDDAIIAAVPAGGGSPRVVVEGGSSAQYVESGHLIYAKAGTLLAMPFDPVAARATGAAIAVVDRVRTNSLNGAWPVGVSASGLLVYLPGENTGAGMSLVAANRNGPGQVLLDRRLINPNMKLSPDGSRLALTISDGPADIWILELESRGLRQVTSGAGTEDFPVWSPDGTRLYYSSNTGGVPRSVTKAVVGSDAETEVTPNAFFPMSISPDGKTLAGRQITKTSFDVVTVDIASRKATAFAASPASETGAAFSPDGRLIAYQSDESGANEVWVQEFPPGSKWQVTTGGGTEPRWTTGGREIVYRNGSTIYAVPVTPRPFSKGPAQTIFSAANLIGFDVAADGKRIVAVQQGESLENPHLVLVSSWFEELKARMRSAR